MQQIQDILKKLFRHQHVGSDFDLKGNTTALLAKYAYLPIVELLQFKPEVTAGYREILAELDDVNVEATEILLLKGLTAIQSGSIDAANYLQQAQSVQVTPLGYSYLALHYFIHDEPEKAVQIYTKAIVDFPKEPYFYACRCILNRNLDDDEGAFYDYQVAKRLDFNYHSLLEWHEHLPYLVTLKAEQVDIQDLERSWRQNPDNMENLTKLALEYVHIYDYQQAIALYSEGLMLSSDSAEWYVYRAAIYSKLTLYVLALEDCDQALIMDKSCVSAYILRAKLHECLGKDKDALADYKKAESINPDQSVIYEERASLFERLGKDEDAIVDYSKLIALMKDDFYPYVLRADVFERLGKQEEALLDYNRAIDLNPYYSDLYQYRAAIKESLGDRIGAEADLQKFEELDEE
ncbi:tetratricopeptide repeat protein [Sphingobacterium faecium]|jgi:tetratricopeptide (TPR) repeat protein|uniref:tetratricopeptide repeat protein n=1 Tax=Sphingobacterium TaxID=28453 RepID=UPI0025DBEF60|nr:tetratricopeptide repeat protein [Sphingobacterium sp. UBA6320]